MKNVNMKNFKDTKQYFMSEMATDWDEKEKFLSKKQLDLLHKVICEMTDEQGEEWFKKWYTQYQLERISTAFWKCYNRVLRFKQKENMIKAFNCGEKLPREMNAFVIGQAGSGKVRRFLRPITGEELLNTITIRGECTSFINTRYTDEEIYETLKNCKSLLEKMGCLYSEECEFEKSLSSRQNFCACSSIKLIMESAYNQAMHEFQDCIADYGKGRNRPVTMNEYILYNCILDCFLAKLEKKESISEGDNHCDT